MIVHCRLKIASAKQGERNLLGAVVKGVPKLNTPMHCQLVLVVVTGGSPELRVEKKCRRPSHWRLSKGWRTSECYQAIFNGARSYSGRLGARADLPSVEFQKRAPGISGRVFFVRPGSQGRHQEEHRSDPILISLST